MCFDLDSRPPIAPIAGGAVDGRRQVLVAADGTRLASFVALADRSSGAGMLVLPDVRGLHPFYEDLALRFAEAGLDALAIDYFSRTAGNEPRAADFDHQPHVKQTRYPDLLVDMAAGAAELRRRRPELHALFSVGFCYGGRLALLAATRAELGLAGAIGFYGVPVGAGRAEMPAPAEVARDMRCPILGLFGGDDPSITPESVAAFESALTEAGVEHELVTYPGAPHSFFDRKATDFAAESADAWRRVQDFVSRLTPAQA